MNRQALATLFVVSCGAFAACGGKITYVDYGGGGGATGVATGGQVGIGDVTGMTGSAGSALSAGGVFVGVGGSGVAGGAIAGFAGKGGAPSITPGGSAGATDAGASGNGDAGAYGDAPVCRGNHANSGYMTACPNSAAPGNDCHAFELVAAYWIGGTYYKCIEAVEDVSPLTGLGVGRGYLSDLNSWSNQLVERADATGVDAIGLNFFGKYRLYSLSLAGGSAYSAAVAHDYVLAGVLSSGMVVGLYTEGGDATVDLISEQGGATVNVGSIVDLKVWSSQAVLDRVNNKVIAVGSPAANLPSELYTFDLSLGSTFALPLSLQSSVYLGGVTADGKVVAADHDANGWFIELITPSSGSVEKKGYLADLTGFFQLVYDPVLGVAHTVGTNTLSHPFLYNFDLATGTVSQVATNSGYVLAKQ